VCRKGTRPYLHVGVKYIRCNCLVNQKAGLLFHISVGESDRSETADKYKLLAALHGGDWTVPGLLGSAGTGCLLRIAKLFLWHFLTPGNRGAQ
jgi:hypothetical protein